jgi:TonB family protein
LDDVKEPELEDTQFNDKAIAEFNEEDLNSDLEKVDQKNSKKVQALAQDLEQDANSVDEEQAQALADAEAKTREESAAIAARADALREKNAKAVAAAQAQENANREAQVAAAAAAAASAKKAAAAQKAAAEGSGSGAGAVGKAGGVPEGVRALSQLRQVPGNPRPTYSAPERIARHEGEAVYLAYITKSGTPTDFKKMKTTGFENLDEKTLAALKRWKFYPGQEGWVEIPFRWKIRGESQETSALSRGFDRQMPEKSEE